MNQLRKCNHCHETKALRQYPKVTRQYTAKDGIIKSYESRRNICQACTYKKRQGLPQLTHPKH